MLIDGPPDDDIRDLVRTGALPAVGIAGFVTLPTPAAVLPAAALRQLASCALIRLNDGTIWLLRTGGGAWSDDRLEQLAKVLAREAHLRHDLEPLTVRLRHELRAPALVVLRGVLHAIDVDGWGLRQVAVGVAVRARRKEAEQRDPAAFAAATQRIEDQLQAALRDALVTFHAGADGEAIAAAVAATGSADLATYNFLVEARHRAWRLQFARSFPLLLQSAATGGAGSVGETFRTTVDRGTPLVKHLAMRWGVGPSVLRGLRNRDAALVGARWIDNVRGLVRLLDALRPEDRPRADPAAWCGFNRAVAAAERLFQGPPWASPLAQMWLRDAIRRGPADLDESAAQRLWSPAVVAAVQQFREALARFLELEHETADNPAEGATRFTFDGLASRFIASRQPRRLEAIAERFAREWRDPPPALVHELARLTGDACWPLLAAEMLSVDGSRIAAPLTERAALDRHGAALDICLTGSYLGPPGIDARNSSRFIIGLLHRTTRAPVSTAEIRVARSPRTGSYELEVLQHTGSRNHPPSQACVSALAEAVAGARSRSGQEHLDATFRAMRARGLVTAEVARRQAERILLAEVLTRTLGTTVLTELSSAVRRQTNILN